MIPLRLFTLGAFAWITTGLGHLVLVDYLTLWKELPLLTIRGQSDIFQGMARTDLSYGTLIGHANTFRALQGLSVWLGVSAIAIGGLGLAVVRHPGATDALRRRMALANSLVIAVFSALSWTCFINPPRLFSTIGAVAFLLAAHGFRRRPGASPER